MPSRPNSDSRSPGYWLLRNLSPNDVSPDGQGMIIPELQQAMSSYLGAEDDLQTEAQVLVGRGWLTRDDEGRLWITAAGDQARADLKQHAPAMRDRIHQGIDDADYVTTLKVLQQMIRNTARTGCSQASLIWHDGVPGSSLPV